MSSDLRCTFGHTQASLMNKRSKHNCFSSAQRRTHSWMFLRPFVSNPNGCLRGSVFIPSVHLVKWASGLLQFHARVGKEENAAIMSPDVDVFHRDIYFHLTGPLFLPPDKRKHLRRHRWDEVTSVIGGQAHVRKGSREFTKACTTLSASSDTVAFPADKTMEADSHRAFCSVQLPRKKKKKRSRIFAKMLKQSRSRVQFDFFFFSPWKEILLLDWKANTFVEKLEQLSLLFHIGGNLRVRAFLTGLY